MAQTESDPQTPPVDAPKPPLKKLYLYALAVVAALLLAGGSAAVATLLMRSQIRDLTAERDGFRAAKAGLEAETIAQQGALTRMHEQAAQDAARAAQAAGAAAAREQALADALRAARDQAAKAAADLADQKLRDSEDLVRGADEIARLKARLAELEKSNAAPEKK